MSIFNTPIATRKRTEGLVAIARILRNERTDEARAARAALYVPVMRAHAEKALGGDRIYYATQAEAAEHYLATGEILSA